MSDILIRGMEMPKDCESCSFCDYEQANCLAANDRNTLPHSFTQRPVWCPLVEVPPHGRLIEAGKLKSALWKERIPVPDLEGLLEEEVAWRQGKNVGLLTAHCCVNNAPTIIPADPAEEK